MIDFVPLDLAALLAPISAQQPAGHFNEEDTTYQTIDQEMVKLGGLNESGMDWPSIDKGARKYLVDQSKHFRVAGHLITARLRARNWPQWVEAAGVLAGMVQHYWETGYPKPGPTGYLAKRKMAAVLIERLTQALPTLDPHSFSQKQQEAAQQALDRLQASAAAAQLDAASLAKLETKLHQQAEAARFPDAVPITPTPSPGQTGGTAISEAFFSTPSNLKLGEERDNRRSLLAVADFINQQDPYDPTGYQLRRFALWAHLHAAPPVRREQRTELMGVPADIVQSYQEALRNNVVNPVLLQRVEKSVASSPYWIRGSFLAAGIAARLEMKEVADAIRHATERFVRRIPTLTDLCFNDGRPFVDKETLNWLSGAADSANAAHVQEYGNLRDELVAQLDNEGVEVVLRRLQDLQTSHSAPRQRCYATVIAADLLASRGLSWLADDLYAGVVRAMQSTPAEQWEPSLYEHLVRQQPAQALIEPTRKG
ncbi:type VI secretion system protein TssA [Dyella terrae]|uniref:type VI secretion system protein TssA n=1 Tax=Dyella terrae TaxID=522259 RepID=UPI001EFED730|nr:type VI secretion system protein TssA [Dyella terrae]ULU26645.1 type VI secretion system protein TssA [Dyella terrae]